MSRGYRIGFEVFGAADGRPLLLLPTWPVLPMRHWANQVVYFSMLGLNVVAYDSPGTGLGERTLDRHAFEFDRIVEQGIELLDHLGVFRTDVFGFSRGVAYALTMATRFPHRVHRLVLIGGAVDAAKPWTGPRPSRPAAANFGSDQVRLEAFYRMCFNEPKADGLVNAAVAWGLDAEPGLLDATDYGADLVPLHSTSEVVYGPRGPGLLIHGEEDLVAPVEYTRKLAALRQDFQAVVLEGRGHAPHMTAAEEVNGIIAQFLGLRSVK